MEQIQELYKMIINTPNNMELGKIIRKRFGDEAYENTNSDDRQLDLFS